MKMKSLGETKLKVSALGLNCADLITQKTAVDSAQIQHLLNQALAQQINFFDLSLSKEIEINEKLLGTVFEDQWNKIVIASSPGTIQASSTVSSLKTAADASLQRLGVDVIDLYYLPCQHLPWPLEEAIYAMEELIIDGKIRYLGLSHVDAETLLRAQQFYPITAIQVSFQNNLQNAMQMISLCDQYAISLIASHPFIFQHTMNLQYDQSFVNQELKTMAKNLHCTPAQLSLAWLMSKSSSLIPLPKIKNEAELLDNLAVLQLEIPKSLIAELDHFIFAAV